MSSRYITATRVIDLYHSIARLILCCVQYNTIIILQSLAHYVIFQPMSEKNKNNTKNALILRQEQRSHCSNFPQKLPVHFSLSSSASRRVIFPFFPLFFPASPSLFLLNPTLLLWYSCHKFLLVKRRIKKSNKFKGMFWVEGDRLNWIRRDGVSNPGHQFRRDWRRY